MMTIKEKVTKKYQTSFIKEAISFVLREQRELIIAMLDKALENLELDKTAEKRFDKLRKDIEEMR